MISTSLEFISYSTSPCTISRPLLVVSKYSTGGHVSHEYGDQIEPFDKTQIDEWVMAYLNTFLDAPDLRIASRWHGTYARHKTEPYAVLHPAPRVTAITGLGGAGMTLSFGLAEQVVARELDASAS